MNELTEEELNNISLTRKVSEVWGSYLKENFPERVAQEVYDDLHLTAKNYQKQRSPDLSQLFKDDRPGYFKLVATSIGYTAEQISRKYFVERPKV